MILNKREIQYSKNYTKSSQIRYRLTEGRGTRSAEVNDLHMGWFLPYWSETHLVGLYAANCGQFHLV